MTTLYRVVPVQLVNGNRTVDTHAFLDSGSSSTLRITKLAKQLGLTCLEKFRLGWLNGSANFRTHRVCVNIVVPAQRMQEMRVSTHKLSLHRHTISEGLIKKEELDILPIEYV